MSLHQFSISIASWAVTLVLRECSDKLRSRVVDWYSAFSVPTQPNVLAIDVHEEAGEQFVPQVGPTWIINTWREDNRIEFESHFEKGWIDLNSQRGALVIRPEGDTENFLRVLYAWLCIDAGALLLHSSAIIRDGLGYVFFGPSGSGKTTTTRLSSEHLILSDDMAIIRKIENQYRVFGVPFRGTMPEAPRANASAELRGLFTLVKDTENRLEALTLPQAVAELTRCVPYVMARQSSAQRVMAICADLAQTVPVQAMHFRRDDSFWEMIH